MSVRYNGVKHSNPATLSKLVFAALLAFCSSAWSAKTATTTERGLVAEDQAKAKPADTALTRQIRADMMADKNLSTSARNIQIITLGDTVTLKGQVATESEKSRVLEIANRVASTKQVVSEIEVSSE